jgi:branched-chain amino acid transport system ATP-binding protein
MTILEVIGLTKKFRGLTALDNITLSIEEGKVIGLIGPNGSGKTTLFNVICGFYKPDKGEVRFDGRRISGLSPTDICRLGIGRTFQIVKPFHTMTVMDNLRVAAIYSRRWKGQDIRKKCEEILKITGLYELSNIQASMLTLAHRKRLELARALATNPKLILLDEILAGLNLVEIGEGLEAIRKVIKMGVTVFMIEHIMKAIMSISDRVIVLHHGEMIAEGKPQEVSEDKKVIEAYLGGEIYS